jgi:small subunit ribosomal protein S4
MARYIVQKCRMCRRRGVNLYLKGERCDSEKCPLNTKNQAPDSMEVPEKLYQSTENNSERNKRLKGFTEFWKNNLETILTKR